MTEHISMENVPASIKLKMHGEDAFFQTVLGQTPFFLIQCTRSEEDEGALVFHIDTGGGVPQEIEGLGLTLTSLGAHIASNAAEWQRVAETQREGEDGE